MRTQFHIGLAFDPESPWLREVFPGIVRFAEERGDWRLQFIRYDWKLHDRTLPDAVLYEPKRLHGGLETLPRMSLNVSQTPQILTDNRRAGELACEHLLQRGYRQLFFFQSGNLQNEVPRLREEGFAAAARNAGLSVTRFDVGKRTLATGRWVLEDQIQDLGELLQELPKPIGASACDPDHVQRLHQVCMMQEFRIPEDIGIISPTESTVVLPYLPPGISSVKHQREQIGYEAARLLQAQLDGEVIPETTRIPPQDIIVRGSTDHRVVGDPLCEEIVKYIWDHLEEAPDTRSIAKRFHLSERTLYRRFQEQVGRTPSEEIRYARIESAKRYLRTTQLPLIDIALECGYGGQSQFNRDIKRVTGMTPGQLRGDI